MSDSTPRLPFSAADRCRVLFTKHGHLIGEKYPRSYKVWSHMKGRCLNPNDAAYARYGGRGIRICARWKGFAEFYDDMGERPDGRSIDRIDNDAHYSCGKCDECRANGWPSNCRWATPSEQSTNTRRTRRLLHEGKSLTIPEAAALVGLDAGTIRRRILSQGMSVEDAVFAPKRGKLTEEDVRQIRALYAAGGVTYIELAKRFGVTKGMIGFIIRGEQWRKRV